MENQFNQNSMRQHVLDAVKTGHLAMRPRWHFILRAVVFAIIAVILGLVLIYVFSFIIFVERQNGAGFINSFGARGWLRFLGSLPWLLVLLCLVFGILLEVLVRRYSFAYRRPLLYSVAGIVCLALMGGLFLVRTQFHARLIRFAQENHVPFAVGLYRNFGHSRFDDIYLGIVNEPIATSSFILVSRHGDAFTVTITPQTRLPFDQTFMQDDPVVVFGDREGTSTIRAFGIRKIDEPFVQFEEPQLPGQYFRR